MASTTGLAFKRAERSAVKLKILLDGASGSGKTWGALSIAEGIAAAEGGRIALIDSERGRASLYADKFDFDTLQLTDRHCDRYVEAIEAAVSAGYPVAILDSLSHAWQDVLNRKDQYSLDNPKSNQWAAWGLKQFGPAWDRLIDAIMRSPIHIIATARSKEAYEQREQGGSKSVVKLGLQPQVREGTMFEFALAFSIEQSHRAQATKDNTRLFPPDAEMVNLGDGSVPAKLLEWLQNAKPADLPEADTVAAVNAAIRALPESIEPKWRKAWAAKRLEGCNELEAQEILSKALAAAEKHKPAPTGPPAGPSGPQPPAEPAEKPQRVSSPHQGASAPAEAPKPAPETSQEARPADPEPAATPPEVPPPTCPTCGGTDMVDFRGRKSNPRAPDFKCKKKGCGGVLWPGQWPPKVKGDPAQQDLLEGSSATTGTNLDAGAFENFPAARPEDDDLPF